MSADVSRHSIKSTLRLASLLSIASWLFSACGASSSVGVSGTALSPKFTVAPHFQPTYSEHDGLETLGDPISPEKLDGGIYYQYFQNGRLEFNGAAADGAQVSLSPLVLEIRKPDPPNTGSPSARALCFAETGHCVNHAFRPYFEKYGGVYYFGYPITDMKVEDGRVVQYFERAMFVWDETLPPDHQVRLAAIGIWKCAIVNCTAVDSASPATPPPDSTQTVMEIVPAIGAFVSHYGGADVFGIPISEPQKLADGTIEQYYENVIFVADSTAPEGVRLRPLGQEFKNGPDPAVAPSSDPDAVFEPATGHNIVNPFRQFYDEHGGYIVFGHPIGEMQIKGGILVQYFENARMEWHGGAPKGFEMRLTNYGRRKLEREAGAPQPALPTPLHPPQSLKLNAWAESPILPLGQSQTLHAQVMNEQNVAVVGASVVAIIHTSGGDFTFVLPPTREDGQTSVTFVLSAWNAGAFVTYEMRATYQSLTSEPARDSFVQWFGATPTPTPSS